MKAVDSTLSITARNKLFCTSSGCVSAGVRVCMRDAKRGKLRKAGSRSHNALTTERNTPSVKKHT